MADLRPWSFTIGHNPEARFIRVTAYQGATDRGSADLDVELAERLRDGLSRAIDLLRTGPE